MSKDSLGWTFAAVSIISWYRAAQNFSLPLSLPIRYSSVSAISPEWSPERTSSSRSKYQRSISF